MDRKSKKMWLKDFLPDDLEYPVRILTYGYNTVLAKPTERTDTFTDLARDFLEQLISVRGKVRSESCITTQFLEADHER